MLVPAISASGGIKNYFQVLEGKFTLNVDYVLRGARNWPYRAGMFKEMIRIWKDLMIFRQKINSGEYSVVQTSTSLGGFSVMRDGIFLYLAQKRGIKTVVFYHGWNLDFEATLEKHFLWIFRRIYLKADTSIVLANRFREKLIQWGYRNDIHVESTLVEDDSIKGISEQFLTQKYTLVSPVTNLLYLARV